MNGIDFAFNSKSDDVFEFHVCLQRPAGLADDISFVRLESVQGVAVFVRINSDGANTQFVGAAKYADGDLATIGNKKSSNWLHGIWRQSRRRSVSKVSPRHVS